MTNRHRPTRQMYGLKKNFIHSKNIHATNLSAHQSVRSLYCFAVLYYCTWCSWPPCPEPRPRCWCPRPRAPRCCRGSEISMIQEIWTEICVSITDLFPHLLLKSYAKTKYSIKKLFSIEKLEWLAKKVWFAYLCLILRTKYYYTLTCLDPADPPPSACGNSLLDFCGFSITLRGFSS